MNVLIIYAHPNQESFNGAILAQVKKGLEETTNSVTIIDLYQEEFDPVLRFNSTNKGRYLHQDPETEKYRTLIHQADHLIFIYPIWWYGLPAILKGFIDRVFVSEFAYTYDDKLPKGLLKGKSAWAVYTIDSPKWYVTFFHRSMEWRNIKNAILKFCGFGKVERLMFAGLKESNRLRREKWLQYLYNRAKNLG